MHIGDSLRAWVDAQPAGAKARGVGGDEDVLGGCGAVLHPVVEGRLGAEIHIGADYNGAGGLLEHLGVLMDFGDFVEDGALVDDDEVPGLLIGS